MIDISYFTEGENAAYVDLIVKYYGLCWVFHIFSAVVSQACFPAYKEKTNKKGLKEPTTLADKVNWDYTNASILYCAAIFYFYVAAVLEMKDTLEGRWTTSTFNSSHGIAFHIASSLYETTCYVFANKGLVFYAHHVVTVGGCCSMLFNGRASFWCCLLGLVEGTNIPLGFVLGGPFRTTSFKDTLIYKINGILLWIMYIILRGPVVFGLMWLQNDIKEHGLEAKKPIAYMFTDANLNMVWNVYMWVVGLFLWGLSIVWFSQITNGMLKALGLKKSKPAKKVD
jgi:hypothetical protein